MKLKLILCTILIITFSSSWGQVFEPMKLAEAEIPKKYKKSEKILSKAIQPKIFYENPDLYEFILGKVKSKDFQSFTSKEDQGTVFFFEYEKNITGSGFLEGLLWGGNNPTKDHPEEYLIKDNILIIWSFANNSEVKGLSKNKIMSL